jgi:hypothetical protein
MTKMNMEAYREWMGDYTSKPEVKAELDAIVINFPPETSVEDEQEAERLQPTTTRRMVKCNCGHTVPQALVMSANLGTSCPDCYDRMSD